jgi:hypothetical protein
MRYSVIGLGKLGCSMAAALSVEIARHLAAQGLRVLAHDPLAGTVAAPLLGGVEVVHNVRRVPGVADLILITTPDAAYRGLRAAVVARAEPPGGRGVWRILRAELESSKTVAYLAVGIGSEPGEAQRLRDVWSVPELRREEQ